MTNLDYKLREILGEPTRLPHIKDIDKAIVDIKQAVESEGWVNPNTWEEWIKHAQKQWYERFIKEITPSENQADNYTLDIENMTELAQALRYDNAGMVWDEMLKAAKKAAGIK